MRSTKPAARTWAAMVSIGLAVLAAGCDSGGSGEPGTGLGPPAPVTTAESTEPPAGESPEPPASRYQRFGDVPGPAILHTPSTQSSDTLTIDVKVMKVAWTAQFQSEPADAGRHFLVVHMALTATAKDRGMRGLTLYDVKLRHADTSVTGSPCRDGRARPAGKYCTTSLRSDAIVSELIPLSSDWETHQFASARYTGTDIVPGLAYAGVGAYEIPDDLRTPGGFELCGSLSVIDPDYGMEPRLCMPLDTPARPRG